MAHNAPMLTPDTLNTLADRVLTSGTGSRALDVEVEVALFRPDDRHSSARPGDTAECVEYTTWAGETEVFPPYCWSLYPVDTAVALRERAEFSRLPGGTR
jgi:hypothetical protein